MWGWFIFYMFCGYVIYCSSLGLDIFRGIIILCVTFLDRLIKVKLDFLKYLFRSLYLYVRKEILYFNGIRYYLLCSVFLFCFII